MPDEPSAKQTLATMLCRLYEAARPTASYAKLIAHARKLTPPVKLSPSKLSSWLNTTNPVTPGDQRSLVVVVEYLRSKVKSPAGLPDVAWFTRQWALARSESERARGGRPATPRQKPTAKPRTRFSYTGTVRTIAGYTPTLIGREAELEELTRFATSGDFHQWWKAGPWAGKTALAAHFALNPPDSVQVVSFFVSRSRGQQTTEFYQAVCEQLAAVVGETVPAMPSQHHLNDLWLRAGDHVASSGEHLVLVVDGLDESTGPTALVGLLPSLRTTDHAHVVLFSREGPDLSAKVHVDHPLRGGSECSTRSLAPSPHAVNLRDRALADLSELLLAQDQTTTGVLGLLAVAGPLTVSELAEILRENGRAPTRDVRRVVASGVGRLVQVVELAETADPRYALAHEELRRTTREDLSQDEAAWYRSRVHAWAEHYASLGWPDDTPAYLTRYYAGLLAAGNDAERLTGLVHSTTHTLLLRRRFGHDGVAVRLINTALEVLADAAPPDLVSACTLAVRRQLLFERTAAYPPAIAETWALLGQWDRATHLATGMISPLWATKTLVTIAVEAAKAGETSLVTDLVRQAVQRASTAGFGDEIGSLRSCLLTAVCVAAARLGDFASVEAGVDAITDPRDRAVACAAVAEAASECGLDELADRLFDGAEIACLANGITEWDRHEILRAVCLAATRAADHERAWRIAALIGSDAERAETLALVAVLLIRAGDQENGSKLVRFALDSAGEARDRISGILELAGVRGVTSAAAEPRLPWIEVRLLTGIALATIDPDDVRRAADACFRLDAEEICTSLPDIVLAAHLSGDAGFAEYLFENAVELLEDSVDLDEAKFRLERAAALSGRFDLVTPLLADYDEECPSWAASLPHARQAAASALAGATDLATAQLTQAELATTTGTGTLWRVRTLSAVVDHLVRQEQFDRAMALLPVAVGLAPAVTDTHYQEECGTQIATAALGCGKPDLAHLVLSHLEVGLRKARAFCKVAAAAGSRPLAERFLDAAQQASVAETESSDGHDWREMALHTTFRAALERGDTARAHHIVSLMGEASSLRAGSLVELARVENDGAEIANLLAVAESCWDRTEEPVRKRAAATGLVEKVAKCGDHPAVRELITRLSPGVPGQLALAGLAADSGDRAETAHRLDLAIEIAEQDEHRRDYLLKNVAMRAWECDDPDRSLRAISLMTSPRDRLEALARNAEAAAEVGDEGSVARLTELALEAYYEGPGGWIAEDALSKVSCALASVGEVAPALEIVRLLYDKHSRAKTLAILAEIVAGEGDHDHAVGLLDDARSAAESIFDRYDRVETYAIVLSIAGDVDPAWTAGVMVRVLGADSPPELLDIAMDLDERCAIAVAEVLSMP